MDRRAFLGAMAAGATALKATAATTERPFGETGVPLQGSEPLPLGPLLPEQRSQLPTFRQMTSDGPESRWFRLVILCNRGARPCKTQKIRSLRLRAANPGIRAN